MARRSTTPAPAAVLDVPVAFGNFSSGDKVCRIGLTVARENLTIAKADKTLCDCRLTGKFYPKLQGEAKEQGTLSGMDEKPVVATFDVKGFSVHADKIKFGATFMKKSVDKDALMELAQRSGRLVVTSVEEIDGEGGDDDDWDPAIDTAEEGVTDDDFEE